MATQAFAPAKINLTLHVTGQRSDGYHLLDSLVVFADIGDVVRVQTAPAQSLTVTGPCASGVPTGPDNLVLRAANWLGTPPAAITLEKHLPTASGIGGGSSDAAATLRALSECFAVNLPTATAELGADVPVCLAARPTRMTGIGDALIEIPSLPPLHFVLVNPGVPVATADVFRKLTHKDNRPMLPELPPWKSAQNLADWLALQRNDLEPAARSLRPAIGVILSRIAQTGGCLLARMSGSGATCFGLYGTRPEADFAAQSLIQLHPDWWIKSASSWQLGDPPLGDSHF